MRAREELEERCARERARRLGGLTPPAFEELRRDVHENLSSFIVTDDQRAFQILASALERYYASVKDDDMRSDDEFMQERTRRLSALIAACREAESLDPSCLDAALMEEQAKDLDPLSLLGALMRLEDAESRERGPLADLLDHVPTENGAVQDAWSDVYLRPRLRLRAATVRSCVDTAHYRMALHLGEEALQVSPADPLGIRNSLALAAARLEDEDKFQELEGQVQHHGNSWWHLGRVLLLFKLGRMPAAKRALRGYDTLVRGGAYALLKPVYVEICIPDRPSYAPMSFEEAMLAVHEADPIVADTPDFISWCESQSWFVESAKRFCDEEGLDWSM